VHPDADGVWGLRQQAQPLIVQDQVYGSNSIEKICARSENVIPRDAIVGVFDAVTTCLKRYIVTP
jgi:hypothetical protein